MSTAMVKLPLSLLAGAALVATPTISVAQSAFNDFSSSNGGYGYDNTTAGYEIEGSSVFSGGQNLGRAMQFTSLASGGLAQIDLALWCSTGPLSVTLTTDTGLSTPAGGITLDTWSVTPPSGYSNSTFAAPTSLAGNGVALTAGSKYWIDIMPVGPTVLAGWYFDSVGATGYSDYSLNGTWATAAGGSSLAAFDVTVTPEPFTIGVGLVGAAIAVSRRRRTA